MTLTKVLLTAFYYYLLTTTTVSFFIFISTFNNLHDGNKESATLAPAFTEIARIMWATLLALHALGLFAVIVLRRKVAGMSPTVVVISMTLMLVIFILPSFYFIGHLIWSSHAGI